MGARRAHDAIFTRPGETHAHTAAVRRRTAPPANRQQVQRSSARSRSPSLKSETFERFVRYLDEEKNPELHGVPGRGAFLAQAPHRQCMARRGNLREIARSIPMPAAPGFF